MKHEIRTFQIPQFIYHKYRLSKVEEVAQHKHVGAQSRTKQLVWRS